MYTNLKALSYVFKKKKRTIIELSRARRSRSAFICRCLRQRTPQPGGGRDRGPCLTARVPAAPSRAVPDSTTADGPRAAGEASPLPPPSGPAGAVLRRMWDAFCGCHCPVRIHRCTLLLTRKAQTSTSLRYHCEGRGDPNRGNLGAVHFFWETENGMSKISPPPFIPPFPRACDPRGPGRPGAEQAGEGGEHLSRTEGE